MAIKEYGVPGSVFPTQTGNSGKYLTTNGSAVSWDAGSSFTLLATVSASGSVVNIENIPQGYKDLRLLGVNLLQSGGASTVFLGANGATGTSYYSYSYYVSSNTLFANATASDGNYIAYTGTAGQLSTVIVDIFNYSDTANSVKAFRAQCSNKDSQANRTFSWGDFVSTSSARSGIANITSLNIRNSNNWTSGTFYLYGVK